MGRYPLRVLRASVVKFSLRPEAIPRVRLAGGFDAQGVDRGAGGKEQCPQIGAAKGQIGRYLGRTDYAEPYAGGREDPGAARAGAVDPAVLIDLHAVGDAVGLFRG